MKRLLIYSALLFSVLLSLSSGFAENTAKKATQGLENQIKRHQKKINEMTDEVMKLDNEIEASVTKITDYISSIKDSTESRSKVITKKEDAIKALVASIDFYRNERAKRLSKYKRRILNSTKKELAEEIEQIDTKIDERIDQIVQITSSLTQDENFNKYAYKMRYSGNKIKKPRKVISKEYKQNQIVASKTKRDQQLVIDGLKNEIEGLEKKNQKLENDLKKSSSEEKTDWLKKQKEKISENIKIRSAQIENIKNGSPPATTPLNNKEVHEMDEKISEMVLKIQDMHSALVKLDRERDRERAIIKPMKNQLRRIEKQAE